MTDKLEKNNNTDLESEGIEIIDGRSSDSCESDINFYTEKDKEDDSSELGLGDDPDNDDDIDFDLDDEESF